MSDVAQGPGETRAGTGAKHGGALGVLLGCFGGTKAAGKARRGLDAQLKAQGAALLDSVVVRVSAKHKASVYDPRRVVQGTLTATLTWGLFGLVAGGLKSLAIWAILGAVWPVGITPPPELRETSMGSVAPAKTRAPRSSPTAATLAVAGAWAAVALRRLRGSLLSAKMTSAEELAGSRAPMRASSSFLSRCSV